MQSVTLIQFGKPTIVHDVSEVHERDSRHPNRVGDEVREKSHTKSDTEDQSLDLRIVNRQQQKLPKVHSILHGQ
jgi:hypothetical protein